MQHCNSPPKRASPLKRPLWLALARQLGDAALLAPLPSAGLTFSLVSQVRLPQPAIEPPFCDVLLFLFVADLLLSFIVLLGLCACSTAAKVRLSPVVIHSFSFTVACRQSTPLIKCQRQSTPPATADRNSLRARYSAICTDILQSRIPARDDRDRSRIQFQLARATRRIYRAPHIYLVRRASAAPFRSRKYQIALTPVDYSSDTGISIES